MGDIFIGDNFLLQNRTAAELYHGYAKDLPILDYHCHLPVEQIARDARFENLTQLWLYGDHYKWRAMRTNGVPERFCTGDASDWEKFMAWAETVPKTLRNPLYHWTHLELQRVFGVDKLLGPQTAKSIWDECNAKLRQDGFSARGIMRRMGVVLVCTTDDPTDTLEHHAALAADKSFPIRVLPAFRPDKGMAVESPERFNAWVDRLANAAKIEIRSLADFLAAIEKRHDYFHAMGCRLSDHGLDVPYAEDYTDSEVAAIFLQLRSGTRPEERAALKFKSAMLYHFGLMDHARGWTQQLHIGALRNPNSRMFQQLGPDTGFDTIGDGELARSLAKFLDRLDRDNRLPKTILYNLNPRDNELMAAMIGSFQDGSLPGKMQFGSAWWFLDQKDGIERQIEALSNLGLLSRFVGMTTDSRSFLSYPRHEYFRRVLCNILGADIENGLLPRDLELVGGMVQDICYRNAVSYFGFPPG